MGLSDIKRRILFDNIRIGKVDDDIIFLFDREKLGVDLYISFLYMVSLFVIECRKYYWFTEEFIRVREKFSDLILKYPKRIISCFLAALVNKSDIYDLSLYDKCSNKYLDKLYSNIIMSFSISLGNEVVLRDIDGSDLNIKRK